MRKISSEESAVVRRSGIGSMSYIRSHHTRGLFYCPDPKTGKINLIESLKGFKESSFNSIEDLEKYLITKYRNIEWYI